jgi:beta-glucosidase
MKTVEELLSLLTLEEKVALVQGHAFMFTNEVPRLSIPAVRMSDGPHGLRIQQEGDNGATGSLPATAFPTASCSANTWNPELVRKMGNAMAEEAQFYGINIILGPGVNIKRNPLCGRNFEYFSEDPVLAGRMGAAEVVGIQEKGTGVSMKHFACNNSENYRFLGNSVADQRALRELYLRQFEYVVKNAHPETLMCAYNKINGVYCSENNWLLNDVLRKEWGFEGLVMSDWGTTHDRVSGVRSGLDLEMPGDTPICRKWLYDAVNNSELSIDVLDEVVRNVLKLVEKHADDKRLESIDWDAHHELAKNIAAEGAVLLKNDGALPLNKGEALLVVGEMFEKMRYQGAGSSLISPAKHSSVKEAFDENNVTYKYVKGYNVNKTAVDDALINEAVDAAEEYDKVVLFAGLTDDSESEGGDRNDMSLPQNQLALIDALVKANINPVVVLFGGSAVELPFYDNAASILNMFLSGQNGGNAAYELLFGIKNPSGRLAETWPLAYRDVPFGGEYAKTAQEVYKESVYVGYRYYLTANKEVRFPLGYGLSYTTFEYSDLKVGQNDNELTVLVTVTNTGAAAGSEVVQIYVAPPRDRVHKPLRELKGFSKVYLNPGEARTVSVIINKEELKFWDVNENRFVLEDGAYTVQAGKNSGEIVLEAKVDIKGEIVEKCAQKVYETLAFNDFGDKDYEELWNVSIPPLPPVKPITLESRLSDLRATFMGRILLNAVLSVPRKQIKKAKKMPEGIERDNEIKGAQAIEKMLTTSSIITLSMASSGGFPYSTALGFRELANGHLIKGIKCFTKKINAPALPIESAEK